MTFEYTFTVKHCIDTIAGFLKCVEVERHPAIAEILTQFESTVRQCPLGCQICPELVPATGSLTTLKAIGFVFGRGDLSNRVYDLITQAGYSAVAL